MRVFRAIAQQFKRAPERLVARRRRLEALLAHPIDQPSVCPRALGQIVDARERTECSLALSKIVMKSPAASVAT